jgi:FkbM family methyltransferase
MASIATSWGVDPAIIEVIPNWAPLDGLPDPVPRSPGDRPLIVYAGTLGLKHDPGLLLDLARALGDDATMLVVSEGPGRRILEQAKSDDDLHGLVLRDYMPVADLDGTLARASVQLVILQGDAGAFSVPSKVLTYLAAGKPVVGSLPPTNAAADVIRASGGGTVVAPDDSEGLIKAVKHYVSDPEAAAEAGRSARRYAEDHFAVGPIADTFEALMTKPRRAGRADRRPVRVAYDSVRRVWEHPSNRGHRSRALARYVGWQVWQRSARRPITVQLAPGRRIRCHPHSPVTSAIIYYGLPDHADMRFVRDYLVAGDVFVDVGAHEGTYSLLATATAGVMAVAVEPSSRSYERLEANIRLNGASDQIHPVRRALGRRAGQVLMRVGSDSMNDVRTVPTEGVETEEVVASTLDEVIDACDVRSVSMIKIDVEGAELDVLAGASSTIAAHRPVLLVEVNDPDRLAAFAVTAGYHPVAYDPERRALVATRVKDRDGSNVLLVPDLGIMASRLAT